MTISTDKQTSKRISEYVGKGYDEFWKFKGRYRVCKGSRASKKSKTSALWFIANLSKDKYREANLLVIRKTYRTLKDSCFKELKWAINRLGLQDTWTAKESPLEIVNRRTGQTIYFRGLDDPYKITSITVEHGYLCWCWIEEAYEIMNESDFDTIDESIRGEMPAPLFKQFTLTFNPWNDRHWIKKRFFDAEPSPDILAMTTNYLCNEWLDEADRRLFEAMRVNNPRRYSVAGEGNWGILGGLIFENWTEKTFDLKTIQREIPDLKDGFGLDYGYTNDPSAAFIGFVDLKGMKIYVWDEMYEKGLSKLESKLKSFMRKLIKAVLKEINEKNGTDYSMKDVSVEFKREVMTNASDNAQIEKTEAETQQIKINTILDLASRIDDESILRLICEVIDLDFDDIKARIEKNSVADLNAASEALAGAQINGELNE